MGIQIQDQTTKMKIKRYIFCFCALSLLVSCGSNEADVKTDKTAYIQSSVVYNEFRMTKDMDLDAKNIVNERQYFLDSLELRIKTLANVLESSKNQNQDELRDLQSSQRLYIEKKDEFATSNNMMFGNMNEDIWKRLNLLIKEYGKANGYDYIFGAQGDGNIMYANESKDISEDVIDFCNKSYLDQ